MASAVLAAPPPPLVRNTYTTNYCTDILINCRAIGIANNNTSIVWNSQWNTINNANIAAIISGGMNNSIAGPGSDVSVIGGGNLNVIAAGADTSVIAGGGGNNINANNTDCVISGGFLNLIDVGTYNTIAGGTENAVMVGDFSTIGGGVYNVMTMPAASAGYSVIAGGNGNTINTHQSVISGGASNLLLHSVNGFSTISGGLFNESSGDFTSSMGGALNTNSGDYSSIIGGYSNRTEGAYSLAGGRSAHSMQNGSWTFKDSSATPLINNQANSLVTSFASGYDFQGGGMTARNITAVSNDWGAAALTVNGNMTMNGGVLSNNHAYADHDVQLTLATNGQPVLVVSNGYVGIRKGIPSYALDVTGPVNASEDLIAGAVFGMFWSGRTVMAAPAVGSFSIYRYGSTAQRYYVNGSQKILTDGAATGIITITSRTNSFVGGTLDYTIESSDGTEHQVLSGIVTYSCVNTNGVWYAKTATEAAGNQATAVTSGTLTTAWTITDAASGGSTNVTINCNANTSLVPTTLRIFWQTQQNSTNTITVL